MKRIISRIALVTLIATLAASTTHAFRTTDALKNFNSRYHNLPIIVPCIVTGIAALTYERSKQMQRAIQAYESAMTQYREQQREFANEISALKRIKCNTFTKSDVDALGDDQQAFESILEADGSKADRDNFADQIINRKQMAFAQVQIPQEPSAVIWIAVGKLVGLFGGAIAVATLRGLLEQIKQTVRAL